MAEQDTTTATQQTILRIPAGLKSLIEGLIFAAEEPLTVRQIKAIYEQQGEGEPRHIEQTEIQEIVDTLNGEYRSADRPYRIIMIAGGYQFATLKEYGEWLGRLFHEQARRRLSQSSLETLAIVAYKQPISKPEIEAIRGVNCDYVMKTLLEKDLVTITGRAETVGRPLLYGTTREFLKHFGLNDVTDLPRPREIEEILGESQFETERRMLEAQAGADQMKKEEDFKSRLPHIPKKKSEFDEEVQIIPKTRTRRLNVRPKEETEAIPEVPPQPDSDQKTKEPVSDSVTQSEPLFVPDANPPEAIPEQAPPSEMDAATPVEVVQPDEPAAEIPEITAIAPVDEQADRGDERQIVNDIVSPESVSVTREQPAPRVPVIEEPPTVVYPHEPEETQPPRSTWSTWKTKIQTFIRKLFG